MHWLFISRLPLSVYMSKKLNSGSEMREKSSIVWVATRFAFLDLFSKPASTYAEEILIFSRFFIFFFFPRTSSAKKQNLYQWSTKSSKPLIQMNLLSEDMDEFLCKSSFLLMLSVGEGESVINNKKYKDTKGKHF